MNEQIQAVKWFKLIASVFAFIMVISAVFGFLGSKAVVAHFGPQYGFRTVLCVLFLAACVTLAMLIHTAAGKDKPVTK